MFQSLVKNNIFFNQLYIVVFNIATLHLLPAFRVLAYFVLISYIISVWLRFYLRRIYLLRLCFFYFIPAAFFNRKEKKKKQRNAKRTFIVSINPMLGDSDRYRNALPAFCALADFVIIFFYLHFVSLYRHGTKMQKYYFVRVRHNSF